MFSIKSSITLQKTTTGEYKLTKIISPEKETIGSQTYPKGTIYEPDSQGKYVARISNDSVEYIIVAGADFMSSSSGAACPNTSYYYKVSLKKGLELNRNKKIITCYGKETIRYRSGGGDTTVDGFRIFFPTVGYFTVWNGEKAEYNTEYDTWVGPVGLSTSRMSDGTFFATKDSTTPAKVVLKTINGVKAYVFISNSIYCGSDSSTWEFVSYDLLIGSKSVLATVNSGSDARKAFLVSDVILSIDSVVRGGCLYCADFTTKTSGAVCSFINFKWGVVMNSAVDLLGD